MSSEEITWTTDGERALREAENFCWRANLAIVSAEHILAGALLVLRETGQVTLPTKAELESALAQVQGIGSEPLKHQVKFGSGARAAMANASRSLREAGGHLMDARALALGTIRSGEPAPLFYDALGLSRADLEAAMTSSPSADS